MQNLQTNHVVSSITTIPPITPPAMAPATGALWMGVGFGDGLTDPILTHVETAQEVHDFVETEHCIPVAQSGHEGVSSGQLRHRRKIVRTLDSMSRHSKLA